MTALKLVRTTLIASALALSAPVFAADPTMHEVYLAAEAGKFTEAQAMMDQGAARQIRDALQIEHGNLKNVVLIGSLCRWMVLAPELNNSVSGVVLRGRVTTAEALDVFNDNPDIAEAADRATS